MGRSLRGEESADAPSSVLGAEPTDKLDRERFGELYRQHLVGVYRFMAVRGANPDDAADLAQQVFLRALAALPSYEDRGLPFSAWLFRIARNVLADSRRQRHDVVWEQLPEQTELLDSTDIESEVVRREAIERVRSLLDHLEPDQRDLVVLHFVGGLTQREIALIVGTSQSSVQRHLARALRTLKERYDG